VIATVCHTETQTSYGNLCLAICSGNLGFEEGSCASSTRNPGAAECDGLSLGVLAFEKTSPLTDFETLDAGDLRVQVNAMLAIGGISIGITCVRVHPTDHTVTLFTETTLSMCRRIGLILDNPASNGELRARQEPALLGVSVGYTILCAEAALTTTPESTTVSAIREDEIDISNTNGASGEGNSNGGVLAGTQGYIILGVVMAILIATLLLIERRRASSQRDLNKLQEGLKSGGSIFTDTDSQLLRDLKETTFQQGAAGVLDQYSEDDAWMMFSEKPAGSSGRLTADPHSWESPIPVIEGFHRPASMSSRVMYLPQDNDGDASVADDALSPDPATLLSESDGTEIYMRIANRRRDHDAEATAADDINTRMQQLRSQFPTHKNPPCFDDDTYECNAAIEFTDVNATPCDVALTAPTNSVYDRIPPLQLDCGAILAGATAESDHSTCDEGDYTRISDLRVAKASRRQLTGTASETDLEPVECLGEGTYELANDRVPALQLERGAVLARSTAESDHSKCDEGDYTRISDLRVAKASRRQLTGTASETDLEPEGYLGEGTYELATAVYLHRTDEATEAQVGSDLNDDATSVSSAVLHIDGLPEDVYAHIHNRSGV
jgi:hypothetical protein